MKREKIKKVKYVWKNVLTFTKKGNDSITIERTKMTKLLYYYGTEVVFNFKYYLGFNYVQYF